jgi:lipopolysaccharide export system ATP-binding protein
MAKREDIKKYLEVLELGHKATVKEIRDAYLFLKKIHSSESIETSPIMDDFHDQTRQKILTQIEDAYTNLMSILKIDPGEPVPSGEEEFSKIPILREKRGSESDSASITKQLKNVLKGSGLTKIYDQRTVVKGVNIEIVSGQITGLLGRNGAGKTTTFQMIVGLIKPNRGAIHLDDLDVSHYSTNRMAKAGISYLPQENSVFLKTTVEKNLKMILQLNNNKKADQKRIIESLLGELGILPLANQSAHSLSGGERRKLEICRSLLINPKFLLLDEPFTGIDPLTIKELQKIFLKLKKQGIGVVISDHNVRDTLKIADRAYVIDEGEILIEGAPNQVAVDERAKERFLGKNFKLGDEVQIYAES